MTTPARSAISARPCAGGKLVLRYTRWIRPLSDWRFLAVLAVLALAGHALDLGLWWRSVVLLPPFRSLGGQAWTLDGAGLRAPMHRFFDLPTDRKDGSDMSVETPEGLLGPEHAAIGDITALGGGRFSYARRQFVFSTLSGADPNGFTQGITVTTAVTLRHFCRTIFDLLGAAGLVGLLAAAGLVPGSTGMTKAAPAIRRVGSWLFPVLSGLVLAGFCADLMPMAGRHPPIASLVLAAWAASFLCARASVAPPSTGQFLAILGIVTAIFDVSTLLRLPDTVLWELDSETYWVFNPQRTAGYGGLMHGFALLPRGMLLLVWFQFLANWAAILYLGYAVRRVLGSGLLAAAVVLVAAVKQGSVLMHFALMTDSLFTAGATTGLAALLLLIERATWPRLLVLGVALSAVALLRPASLGLLLPVVLLLGLLCRRREWRAAAGLAAALALSFAANVLVQPVVAAATGRRDAAMDVMAGYALTGTAGFLLTADTPTSLPALRDRLVAEFAPFRQSWLDAGTLEEANFVLLMQGDKLLYGHALQATCEVIMPVCRNPVELPVVRAMTTVSIDAIRHDPLGMARIFATRVLYDLFGRNGAFTGNWVAYQAPAFKTLDFLDNRLPTVTADLADHGYRKVPTAETVVADSWGIAQQLRDRVQWVNILALTCCLAAAPWGWYARRTGRGRREALVLGIIACGVLWYHLVVSIGQTPFGRYTDPLTAWLVLIVGLNLILGARAVADFGNRAGPAVAAERVST